MQGFNYARKVGVEKAGEELSSARQTIDLNQVFKFVFVVFLIKNNGFFSLVLKTL